MTEWDRMLASIAIDAAKNCIHVFEAEYPSDDRPRKALEAAEKWLTEPTLENSAFVAGRGLYRVDPGWVVSDCRSIPITSWGAPPPSAPSDKKRE